MKISDIINRKKEDSIPTTANEVDSLKKQKEDIEEEMRQQQELNNRVPMPPPDMMRQEQRSTGFFGNQQMPRPREDIEEEMMIQQEPPRPDPRVMQRPGKMVNVKFSVFLENGQKLPIIFPCPEDRINEVMDTIDQKIIDGEMITIGDFKFPGARVLYLDLQGR